MVQPPKIATPMIIHCLVIRGKHLSRGLWVGSGPDSANLDNTAPSGPLHYLGQTQPVVLLQCAFSRESPLIAQPRQPRPGIETMPK